MEIIETNLQFNGRLTKRDKTNYIVLHHAGASRCTVYDVHRWHLNNGWVGIGYAYFVAKDGRVYRGRPYDVVGAHCENYNAESLGICAEGDYEVDLYMPDEQKNAVIALAAELKKIYPEAKVVRHGDLNLTACPGKHFPFYEILRGAEGGAAGMPEQWKIDIINKGRDLKILNQDHDPDETAAKWFAVALAVRLKEEIDEIKATLKKLKEALN